MNLNPIQFTVLEIVEDRLNFSPHTFLETLAKLHSRQHFQPTVGPIVHGFSNVKAKIEPLVVGSPENHYNFASLMLDLCYLQVFVLLQQSFRVNEEGFMTQELRTLASLSLEE